MNQQSNDMENQDSEPLFGDDVYRLLRDDSLLQRIGSTNFATLTEPGTTIASDANTTAVGQEMNSEVSQEGQQQVPEQIIKQERNQCTPEQSTPEQPLIIQQQTLQLQQQDILKLEHNYQAQGGEGPSHQEAYITVVNNSRGKLILLGNGQQQTVLNAQLAQEQCQQPQATVSWDNVDMENEDSMQGTSNPTPIPTTLINNPSNNSFMNLLDEYSPAATPDTTAWTTPSLQPWAGKYNFSASIPTGNKDRNKWCFNQNLKKLYLCPNVAVPVNIKMSSWVNATITITPVFQQSQFRNEPVNRCFNCKSSYSCDQALTEYIVQVDGEGCIYETIQERPIVKVPVPHPPPGESSSTLLVKLMCLTSCVGGPNRRPFCLVLTLHCNLTGSIIGRQVLDLKCCKCPSRDMNNDLKSAGQVAPSSNQPDEGQVGKIRRLSSQIHVNTKRKKPKVKPEPGTGARYVNIAVPVEFELQVKSYVNGLIAESIVRRNQPNLLLYPDNDN